MLPFQGKTSESKKVSGGGDFEDLGFAVEDILLKFGKKGRVKILDFIS
jgi:hypothetical protein